MSGEELMEEKEKIYRNVQKNVAYSIMRDSGTRPDTR